ncbi:MAG: response regulator [Coriobacteriia bacterium]|nr:response regulator [Coriobacteriia bacterium]
MDPHNHSGQDQVGSRPLKTAKRSASALRVAIPLVLALCILVVLGVHASLQRQTVVEQAEYVVGQMAQTSASQIESTCGYAQASIRSFSASISSTMTSDTLEDPAAAVAPYVEHSPFGAVEYIRADGMNVMNPGEPFDARDREYYVQGIKGNTGMWNNYHPKVSHETLINFYTPLMYQGRPCGVITGYLEATRQVAPLLESEFFGQTVDGILLDRNGMVICSTLDVPFEPDMTVERLFGTLDLSPELKSRFVDLLQDETNGSVAFQGVSGEGRLCVSAVPDTDWLVAVIIPSSSYEAVMGATMRNTLVTFALLMLLVAGYFAFVLTGASRERKRVAAENAQLEEENNRFNEQNRRAFRQLQEANARLEEQHVLLEEARDQADAANRAKTAFLFGMSHDIRTPMNAILGFAGLMRRSLDDPKKASEYLDKIQLAGDYLLSLINNVLEVARIDSGRVELDERCVDMLDPGWSVVPMLEGQMQAKNLTFTCDMDIEHRFVYADMHKIKEINMNIMSNAVKYTPEGGFIHMHFEELPCDRPGYARYVNSITDTGIGMSLEFQQQIFESFTREHDTTESRVAGTGLGMAIVKKLVDAMGGSIEVKSELGKGSCFSLYLEHRIADESEYTGEDVPVAVSEGPMESLEGHRILLAEDNDLNAEIAQTILEDAGAQVERVADGAQCVQAVEAHPAGYYDVVLMDIQMPVMDGYEAADRIRALADPAKAQTPIVAATANAFDEDRRNAFAHGMNGHVGKPIRVPELLAVLSGLLSEEEGSR